MPHLVSIPHRTCKLQQILRDRLLLLRDYLPATLNTRMLALRSLQYKIQAAVLINVVILRPRRDERSMREALIFLRQLAKGMYIAG